MRRSIVALIVGVLIGTAGVGTAATLGWSHKSDGVWCRQTKGIVACVPMTGSGYGVAISSEMVVVMNMNGRVVYKHLQPGS